MTVNEIFEFLNSLFPVENALPFDNVGLLIGDGGRKVKKAIVSLDCTSNTVKSAIENNCELIITHHPVIFSPLKSLKSGDIQFELVKSGVSVISMHTNLDIADGGVNDCLCKALELSEIKSFTANDGFILKSGKIPSTSAVNFAADIKKKLGGCVKFVDGSKPIEKVLVCSGSGGDYVTDAKNGGFDALVTADIKHHQFLEAKELQISLFDAGHFNTEDIVIEPLCELLSKQFGDILFSPDHTSYIEYR